MTRGGRRRCSRLLATAVLLVITDQEMVSLLSEKPVELLDVAFDQG
jgi:hypothetical protein